MTRAVFRISINTEDERNGERWSSQDIADALESAYPYINARVSARRER